MIFAPYVVDLAPREPLPVDSAVQHVPFPTDGDFVERWWRLNVTDFSRPGKWYSAMIDGHEMARVQLRIDSAIGASFPTAPRPPRGFLQIVYIEVANHHLGLGIGPAVIAAISAAHPHNLLAAHSSADGFWAEKMRWEAHAHVDGGRHPSLLFVSPA